MSELDDLVVESVVTRDDIDDWAERVLRSDFDLDEVTPREAKVMYEYTEWRAEKSRRDFDESMSENLQEVTTALENSFALGMRNRGSIKINTEMLKDLGYEAEYIEHQLQDIDAGIEVMYEDLRDDHDELSDDIEELGREVREDGFADRFLRKWFGGYTLPTALWKDRVRDKSGIDHNKRKTLVATGGFLAGAGLVASDAGNYAEGDEPAKGGLQLPLGDGDIDFCGILEEPNTGSGSAHPSYVSEVFEFDPDEFKNVYDDLEEIYQEDILEGGEDGDQYHAWFNEDDYEELNGVTFFYNEDPAKSSSVMYNHDLGEKTTNTREVLENEDAADVLYNKVKQE